MKTAVLSFLLAFAAPLAHAACPAPADWAQFSVVIQFSQATPPSADQTWTYGPSGMQQSFSFDSAPLSVRQQSDTAVARLALYNSLASRGVGCEQLYSAEVIAARHGLATSQAYRTEAEAFWAAYLAPNPTAPFLQRLFAPLYVRTAYGTYPAADIADLLELFGF